MEFTADQWAGIVELVRGLSDPTIVREWPPGARVRAKPGVVLLVPAPGVEGEIGSYYEGEDGKITAIGVLGPVTIPHPEHGWGNARPGQVVLAECLPEQIELVDRGVMSDEQIERAIAEATA